MVIIRNRFIILHSTWFWCFFGPTRLTLIEFPVRLTNQPCVLNDCGLKLEKSLGSLNGIRSDLRYASTEVLLPDFNVRCNCWLWCKDNSPRQIPTWLIVKSQKDYLSLTTNPIQSYMWIMDGPLCTITRIILYGVQNKNNINAIHPGPSWIMVF